MTKQKLTDWHRQQAAKVAAAHPLTPAARIRASGVHLLADNDEAEPDEQARIAADLAYNRAKSDGSLRLRDENRALDAQVQRLGTAL